ncbi:MULTISPECIES: hypothetical protein [Micromonospora]|uniref:hypothetical protein n=1 Tax=Micromonospora TaxID=1873 RepID=UPI0004C41E80|nr:MULTISPECIES: hypothetical protein [Micromonospora]RBJ04215.1 hypothetical protein DRA43_14350 [Micromonospora provocatoris]SCL43020.1 hypothetical protein GA0070615_6180 [Micromonospora aurantiaca]
MATNLRIRSLTVSTNTAMHTFGFESSLTFVTGPITMGKSTLLMLIKHALGGNAALTPAVVQHVTHVDVAIQAGDQSLVLRRRIGTDSGAVEVLEPGSNLVQYVWPVSPKPADGPSLSRFLLETLGIPVERVPTSRAGVNSRTVALTFKEIFRYCFLQAKEIDRSVVGHLDTHNNPKRIAAFELMFGLTDPELIELKRQRGIARDRAAQLEKDAAAIDRFIRDAGIADPDELRARRMDLLQQLAAAEDSLQATRNEVDALTSAEEERRAQLSLALSASKKLREEADLLAVTVRGREASLAQLRLDLTKAERRSTAIGLLAPFEFVTCPRCMQDLDSRDVPETDCRLCCQPIPPVDVADVAPSDRNLDRIREQVTETEALLASDHAALNKAWQAAHRADFELDTLSRDYDQATAAAASPRIETVAHLSRQAEALRHSIDEIGRHTTMWHRLDQLRAEVAAHRKTQRQLQVDITSRERALQARAQLDDISAAFKDEVDRIGIPADGDAHIDPNSFLPLVGNTDFEVLQASGGGASTALNVAYHLTLLTTAIDHPDILLPSLLIIDSPRKGFGNSEPDLALGRRIYSRLVTLAQAYQDRIQLIVADNDIPADVVTSHSTIELTSGRSVIPGVMNTGVGKGQRVEDL